MSTSSYVLAFPGSIHSGPEPETITLPDAPAIPGLRFRRFKGESDFPAMVEILERNRMADQLEYVVTLEDLRNTYQHLTHCDPYRDMIMAEIDDQLIGYNRVFWHKEDTGIYLYTHVGFVVPEWRTKGIGRALLHGAEQRLHRIAAGHHVEAPRFFRTEAQEHQTALHRLLREEGYGPIRHGFSMVRSLDEPIPDLPLPKGLEVRPVQPEHTRPIWEAMNEAFRDHWGYSEPTEEMYQMHISNRNCQPELQQVAWDGHQIAGMVLNFIDHEENTKFNRRRGYTEDISVRRPWRGRGLARALLARSLQLHKSLGMTEAALGVDAQNPNGALQLYQSLGFRVVSQLVTYQKPLDIQAGLGLL